MCSVLVTGILCYGALSYAPIMADVATRRYEAGWGVMVDPARFDALLGVQDCGLLGRQGYMVAGGKVYRALVVDCQTRADRAMQPMSKRGLLADVNLELSGKRAYLVLRR